MLRQKSLFCLTVYILFLLFSLLFPSIFFLHCLIFLLCPFGRLTLFLFFQIFPKFQHCMSLLFSLLPFSFSHLFFFFLLLLVLREFFILSHFLFQQFFLGFVFSFLFCSVSFFFPTPVGDTNCTSEAW